MLSRLKKTKYLKIFHVTLLILIVMQGFFFRTYKLGPEIYRSGDAIILPYLVTSSKSIFWCLFHSYGIITPVISEVFMRSIIFSGITINEFWWIFPFAAIGTLTIIFIYMLVKEMISVQSALFASAVIAILPANIFSSRYAYGYETVSLFLAMASLYLFILYLKRSSKMIRILLSITFSCYIMSHPLFFFIFIIFIWTAIIYSFEQDINLTLRYRIKTIFFNKLFIFPIMLAAFFLLEGIYYLPTSHQAQIGSLIGEKLMNKPVSVDLTHQLMTMVGHYILKTFILNSKFIYKSWQQFLPVYQYLPFLTLMTIPFGIKDILSLSKRSIFFIWGVLYLIPFYFIDLFHITRLYTYFNFGLVPLMIYITLFLYDNIGKFYQKHIKNIIYKIGFWVAIICFLLQIHKAACNYLKSVPVDNGIKTMGFYIRNYTNSPFVFCYLEDNDAGYGWLYPLTAEYYFGRCLKYDYYNKLKINMENDFEKNIKDIDIIIITPNDEDYFRQFTDFELKARVFKDKNPLSKEDLLVLYAKKGINLPKMDMDVNKYNTLFDKQFSKEFRKNKHL